MTDPIEFTVELPADGGAQVLVAVYETVEALTAAVGPWVEHEIAGCCEPWIATDYSTTPPTVGPRSGVIRLCQERLGVGVITHECAHMAVHIHQNKLIRLNDIRTGGYVERAITLAAGEDEAFATTLGELARLVTQGLYEHDLIPAVS